MSPTGGAVDAFVAAAVEFCQRVLREDVSATDLVSMLTSLDRLGAQLPSVEPSDAAYPDPLGLDEECRQVAVRIGRLFGERCFYESGPGTVGDLSDDVFDIYRDLRRGLNVFKSSRGDAVWEWKFSHRCHWGVHARAALAAMGQME